MDGIEMGGGAVEVEGSGGKGLGDASEIVEDGVVAVERTEADGWGADSLALTAGAVTPKLVGSAE